MALCPEHPKRDQNPKFTPLRETTSIPVCFIWESPPPGYAATAVAQKAENKDLKIGKTEDPEKEDLGNKDPRKRRDLRPKT